MRHVALGLAALVAACAGAPPPVPHTPEKVAVAEPKPEPPPPPEPLPSQDVELTQKSDFIGLGIGSVEPKLLSDEELMKRLPAAAKLEFAAVESARAKSHAANVTAMWADNAFYTCEACKERAQLEAKHKAAQKAADAASNALEKSATHAERSLDKQLESPKAAPEIGIALARLMTRGLDPVVDSSGYSVEYAEAKHDAAGTEPLERALKLAGADQEPGQRVRQELLLRLRSKDSEDLGRRVIDELLASGPKEWRAELRMRAALYDALDGDDAKAADGFEKALDEHVPGSSVRRKALATGALAARYRALDFDKVLSAAMRVFEEADRPEPPPPEPPPPPPKPKPAKKATKLARKAALQQAAEFGMLGILSSGSFGDSGLDEDGVTRLAADAVERLDRDPTSVQGPARAKASLLSLLAVRSLYRNDTAKAREYAEAARTLGSFAATHDAVKVLRALALADGDTTRAAELEQEASKLPWGRGFGGLFGDPTEPDRRDLEQRLRSAEPSRGASDKPEDVEPAVAHPVRSALRACIEPVRTHLPAAKADGKVKKIATITLSAKVWEDGHADLAVDADNSDGAMPRVIECLKRVGPHMLAHAPASVSAKIVIDESARDGRGFSSGFGFGGLGTGSALGGLIGSEIGESYGVGGLGLRGVGTGGGGTGEGIGLGSIGTLGHGAGAGTGAGYGYGKGGIGRKKKPAPAKKPPPKPAVK